MAPAFHTVAKGARRLPQSARMATISMHLEHCERMGFHKWNALHHSNQRTHAVAT